MIIEIVFVMVLLIIFMLLGIFTNWIFALVFMVGMLFITGLLFGILTLFDKLVLRRIRRKYDGKENESGPETKFQKLFNREKGTKEGGGKLGAVERAEPQSPIKPSFERPRTSEYSGYKPFRDSYGKDGEDYQRDKPNRFTPI